MKKNKENFIKEYKELCKKYNIMLMPDIMAALLLKEFDEEIFNLTFNETCRLENYYETQKMLSQF